MKLIHERVARSAGKAVREAERRDDGEEELIEAGARPTRRARAPHDIAKELARAMEESEVRASERVKLIAPTSARR